MPQQFLFQHQADSYQVFRHFADFQRVGFLALIKGKDHMSKEKNTGKAPGAQPNPQGEKKEHRGYSSMEPLRHTSDATVLAALEKNKKGMAKKNR